MAHVEDRKVKDRSGLWSVQSRLADDHEPDCWVTLDCWMTEGEAQALLDKRAALRPR